MLGQNLQNVVGQIMDFYLAKTYKKVLPKTHYTYDNWEQHMNKINKYTTLAAEKYKNQGKKVSFTKDVVFRPLWGFFKEYIIDLGFLDGKIGWVFAVAHYYYTTMKYAKLYYLYKDNGKL